MEPVDLAYHVAAVKLANMAAMLAKADALMVAKSHPAAAQLAEALNGAIVGFHAAQAALEAHGAPRQ